MLFGLRSHDPLANLFLCLFASSLFCVGRTIGPPLRLVKRPCWRFLLPRAYGRAAGRLDVRAIWVLSSSGPANARSSPNPRHETSRSPCVEIESRRGDRPRPPRYGRTRETWTIADVGPPRPAAPLDPARAAYTPSGRCTSLCGSMLAVGKPRPRRTRCPRRTSPQMLNGGRASGGRSAGPRGSRAGHACWTRVTCERTGSTTETAMWRRAASSRNSSGEPRRLCPKVQFEPDHDVPQAGTASHREPMNSSGSRRRSSGVNSSTRHPSMPSDSEDLQLVRRGGEHERRRLGRMTLRGWGSKVSAKPGRFRGGPLRAPGRARPGAEMDASKNRPREPPARLRPDLQASCDLIASYPGLPLRSRRAV